MHFAIIAAGDGQRLRQEGLQVPKPLVMVDGEPMIGRLVKMCWACGAESVSVICNATMPEVRDYLSQLPQPPRVVEQCTPSSMHSLQVLTSVIPAGRVVVTTVDTIFSAATLRDYVSRFVTLPKGEGLFAVTPFVDDEKPLWVETAGDLICGFHDHETDMPDTAPRLVSGGVYGLDSQWAWPVLNRCIAEGQHRMRNYQRALVAAGVTLRPAVVPHIMDIDHVTDLEKANRYLAAQHV